MAFFQYQRGAIDEARLRSSLKVLNLSNPRMKAFWNDIKQNFVEPYRVYIDQLIEEQDASVQEHLSM